MADDRGTGLEAVVILLLILAIVSTSLRCYSMGFILRRFYIEDWLAMVCLALYIGYSAVALLGVRYGVGKHIEHVAPQDRPQAVMWRWIASLFYIVISSLVKLVVGFFLLRICSHQRWQRITLWVLMGTVTVFNICYFFIALMACRPIEYQWTRYDPVKHEGECNSTLFATVPTYMAVFLNVLADWILPILPATLVWKAKMETRKKISVCAVLALGSIASIASIVRIPYASGVLDNPDYLYTYEPIAAWSTVEIGIAITASSLATLTPLFRKIKIFNVSTGQTYQPAGPDSQFQGGGPLGFRSGTDKSPGQIGSVARPQVSNVSRDKTESDIEAQEGVRHASDEIELYRYGGRRGLP